MKSFGAVLMMPGLFFWHDMDAEVTHPLKLWCDVQESFNTVLHILRKYKTRIFKRDLNHLHLCLKSAALKYAFVAMKDKRRGQAHLNLINYNKWQKLYFLFFP